ncbi:MAG: hypothetical protein ACD_23C01000G0002 [uncultured bacterium]|nr:MAG: hypothetical protein ACD_23C01000G0002 [uncultured bacterium]
MRGDEQGHIGQRVCQRVTCRRVAPQGFDFFDQIEEKKQGQETQYDKSPRVEDFPINQPTDGSHGNAAPRRKCSKTNSSRHCKL